MFDQLLSEGGLSLDRLNTLLKVHDAGSIAAAAPGDQTRQTLYSRQLRELSEYFGCEVTRRQGKVLKLTAEGEQLVGLARSHFRALSDFRAQCREESLDYTIAAGDSVIQWMVIPGLARLPKAAGMPRFAIVNHRTRELVQLMRDGRVDFAIVRRDALPEGLRAQSLGVLSFVALVPKSMVRGAKLTLADVFRSCSMAAQETDGQFTTKLREISAGFGVPFRPDLACQSFPQVLAAVRVGAHAAIVPELAVQDLPKGLCQEFRGGPLVSLERELVLAHHPRLVGMRPKAAHLAKALASVMKI